MARQAGGGIRGSVQVKGGKELDRLLKNLPKAVAKKLLRQALRAGAKIVQKAAKEKAPVDTGQLKKSIKVRAGKRTRKGTISILVQTGEGDFKGEEFYASFLEYGYRRGKRGSKGSEDKRPLVEPKPFMRPAFDEKKDEAVKVVSATLGAGIEKAMAEELKGKDSSTGGDGSTND